MTLPDDQLRRIGRLRELFLDDARGGRRLADYWRDFDDLQAYDRVLAARIGWKWDAALTEARDRGFAPGADARVLDFGCGSGIAARRYVEHFAAADVAFHDRSTHAMEFALREFGVERAGCGGRIAADVTTAEPDVLLVSHVLSELDDRGRRGLRELISRSQNVLIVESGNRSAARRLSEMRDGLLDRFRIVAPCPHAEGCPALATAEDWCHFFAAPPPEVFTDGDWVKTARSVGVDLRALPYAFLALTRDDEPAPAVEPPPNRMLGRPKIKSRDALVTVCTADGLERRAVDKKRDRESFRQLKKHPESVRTL